MACRTRSPIVTGASQGIGRAIALGLAQAGAHLVLAKHPSGRHDEIAQVQKDIEALGRKALIVQTDVSHVADVRAMIDRAMEAFGRIDILVNNAGWTGTGAGARRDGGRIRPDHGRVAEERVLRLPGGGARDDSAGRRQDHQHRIEFRRRRVQVALGLRGGESRACTICRARCRSNGPKQGVTVNVVAPCITETDSRKVILERPGYKEWATEQMLPVGRWNQPEDLVGAVLFLSSHLSDMVVGHVLMVDGGWTDKGSRFGPDLTDIGLRAGNSAARGRGANPFAPVPPDIGPVARAQVELERSILDPGAEILPQNRTVHLVTRKGETITARVLNQDTFSLQLIDTKEQVRSVQKV